MKLVLDSNVIIAAFAARGLCQALWEYCLENHQIIICESILKEIQNGLKKKVKLPDSIIKDIENHLRTQVFVVKPKKVFPEACRDKSDLMVLGSAVAGRASTIITGDKDLLTLQRFEKIEIMNPRSFWKMMKDAH